MNDEQFRAECIDRLARLETKMDALVGSDGNPGRLGLLEAKLRMHERMFWMSSGAGIVVGWILKWIVGGAR